MPTWVSRAALPEPGSSPQLRVPPAMEAGLRPPPASPALGLGAGGRSEVGRSRRSCCAGGQSPASIPAAQGGFSPCLADSNREDFDPAPVKSKFDSLDFDTLLRQAQRSLRR